MAQTRQIRGCYIEHNDDVKNGLDFLEREWNTNKVHKIFDTARRDDHAISMFKINDSDNSGTYVLTHKGGDNFSLSWRNAW